MVSQSTKALLVLFVLYLVGEVASLRELTYEDKVNIANGIPAPENVDPEELFTFNLQLDQIRSQIEKLRGGVIGDSHQTEDRYLHQLCLETSCKRTTICDKQNICTDVCQEGSVLVSEWLKQSLKTQRKLLDDVPFNYWYLPGTHNTAIAKSDRYGLEEDYLTSILNLVDPLSVVYIANQQFSIIDQLNMGIRFLEIDIHWYKNDIRICHAGGIHLEKLDQLIDDICKAFGIEFDWDSETIGCFSDDYITLNAELDKIVAWMDQPGNEDEVFVFYFDDQYDLDEWGKVPYVVDTIALYFNQTAFTPGDKQQYFPNSWPTAKEMLAMGKRVILTSRTDYGEEMYSYLFSRDALWTEYDLSDYQGFSECSLASTVAVNQGNITRVLGDSLIYGPFFDGTTGGLLIETSEQSLSACNLNFPCLDQASPDLMEGMVWTWDRDQPEQDQENICVAMTSFGKWRSLDCYAKLHYACQNSTDVLSDYWRVSSIADVWSKGNDICKAEFGTSYRFAVPVNGFLNSLVHEQATSKKTLPLWINYSSYP
mmetsp:Transcript_9479/g.13059  ORF Transcript_9479/g.13059 Transcript_9479/m.13059 type:complete len:539 (+) Transcript_9479:64-1680(+)